MQSYRGFAQAFFLNKEVTLWYVRVPLPPDTYVCISGVRNVSFSKDFAYLGTKWMIPYICLKRSFLRLWLNHGSSINLITILKTFVILGMNQTYFLKLLQILLICRICLGFGKYCKDTFFWLFSGKQVD